VKDRFHFELTFDSCLRDNSSGGIGASLIWVTNVLRIFRPDPSIGFVRFHLGPFWTLVGGDHGGFRSPSRCENWIDVESSSPARLSLGGVFVADRRAHYRPLLMLQCFPLKIIAEVPRPLN